MAKEHKRPTSVTIASTHEQTGLHDFVERHWKTGVALAIAAAAGILAKQWFDARGRASVRGEWERLSQDVAFEGRVRVDAPQALAGLATELRGSPVAPWAKALEVGARLEAGELETAEASLAELEAGWPNHLLVAQPWPTGDGGAEPLPDQIRGSLRALESWEAEHTSLFENPPLPENAPRVRIDTDLGSIVVGLYDQRAPQHVENFLELCGEGYYDGTNFHRVIADFMIQGGDPNTRDADTATWGMGGPEYKIPPEISDLKHFRYVLAMAKTGSDTQSSGSQFYITTGTPHHLDGIHAVFGKVLEGQEVVDQINDLKTVDRSIPEVPPVILSTEVL